jgi:glycosyltransferase involved in cell wall biosynthesis
VYKDHTVAVVVPAYNEEQLIGKVLETMPDFVDKVVVVNDYSRDRTAEIVGRHRQEGDDRIVLIQHERNRGVGAAIATGLAWARDHKFDIVATMDGDGQMDPSDLPSLLDPIVRGETDFTKGNRLFTKQAWSMMPKRRYLGNAGASLLTKIASGYWHIADSQSGYRAISLPALERLDLDCLYRRYGVPNHLLVMLNVCNVRVRDVVVKPVYQVGEKSGFEPLLMIPKLSFLLAKWFLWRLKEKYVIRDFHPLVFFYLMAAVLGLATLGLAVRLFYVWAITGRIPSVNALAMMFAAIAGLQSGFFAMWFDMEDNKHLR